MRNSIASTFLNVALGLSALTVAGLVVRSELFGKPQATNPSPNRLFLERIPTNINYFDGGQLIGPATTQPSLVVFSDYQCPACKALHVELERRRTRGEHDLAILYRHWPLARHPQAHQAAVASECAARQGRFSQMHDSLFARSADLGSLSTDHFAAMAVVPDVQAFLACMKSDSVAGFVQREGTLAQSIGSRGTPTVVLRDGTGFVGVPPGRVLDSLIKALRKAN